MSVTQKTIPLSALKAINYSLLIILGTLQTAYANTGTEFFLDIRERAETQQNLNDKFYGADPKAGEAKDTYLLSRLRFGLTHQFEAPFKAKVSVQDSRAIKWGFKESDWVNNEFGGIENNPQHDPLELGETWLEYQGEGVDFKVGRQAIFYGNNRVFGPGAWKNSGKWVWDAAKLTIKHDKHWVDAFYGKTKLHDPSSFSLNHRHGYTGSGIYAHLQVHENLAIEPILTTKFNDDSLSYLEKDLSYYGARALFKYQSLKVDATYIRQTGDVTNLNNSKVKSDAYGTNLDVEYRVNPKWMVGATYAFASGDDKSTTKNERFDGVYGASDKYYGRMNLMAWSNLIDYGLYTNFRPHRDWELQLEAHAFYADEMDDAWRAYKNGLKANSDFYGNEIDLTANYKLNKTWQFMAGVGVFLPGEAIKQAVNNNQAYLTDNTAYSGFMQVQYQFKQSL